MRQERIRVVTHAAKANTDFEIEQLVRLTVLEALYTQRRVNPNNPGIFDLDLEGLTGQSRDHLEFTFWYLISKNMVKRGDSSRLLITADGVDYLETALRDQPAAQAPEGSQRRHLGGSHGFVLPGTSSYFVEFQRWVDPCYTRCLAFSASRSPSEPIEPFQ